MTICVLAPMISPEAFLTNYIFIHAIIAPLLLNYFQIQEIFKLCSELDRLRIYYDRFMMAIFETIINF